MFFLCTHVTVATQTHKISGSAKWSMRMDHQGWFAEGPGFSVQSLEGMDS